MTAWHTLTPSAVLEQLEVDPAQGLSAAEVQRRQAQYGPNELVERGVKSPWKILWEQLSETLVVVLLVAAAVSQGLEMYEGAWVSKDAMVIMAIVVLNALIGFRQEYKAEQAMAALKKMAAPQVRVRRAGHVIEIPSHEITVGDVVLLEAGSSIPADGRLIESANLRVQEAALTGESEPEEKHAEAQFEADAALGDRGNMAYLGTAATYGRGVLVVTAIGMETELGNIAEMIQTVEDEQTPLQRRLHRLGKRLALAVLAIVALVFVLGLLRIDFGEAEAYERVKLLFLTAVSLSVAAVPEGLPAVVTIALAIGAQRMLSRRALIRKLPAVETLGSVTAICSDKTGTLTKNEMTVTVLDVAGRRVDLTEHAVGSQAELKASPHDVLELSSHPSLALLVVGSALCNDAFLEEDEESSSGEAFRTVGDPTEIALVAAAARLGVLKSDLESALPRVGELPFDSDRKRMTTMHRVTPAEESLPDSLRGAWAHIAAEGAPHHLAFTKGAIDSVLAVCSHVWTGERAEPLSEEHRRRIDQAHDRLADDGMRVLGVAFRRHGETEQQSPQPEEANLVFVGLTGMIDPPRPEAAQAVAECRAAGIRPLMITGDHPLTARHIARSLGIDDQGGVITGRELDRLSETELEEAARGTSIFARVSPKNKLQLVKSLQEQGQIAAMTGDGVNDAPALKQADIGVAMGITGTDVSKEAADMVLRDDNFATIVAAVREGRIVYDNIRKFIKYTLTSNAGEIWVMLAGPLLGMPLALLPLQILWINLVTDGLPGLALAMEPGERNTMRRPPHAPSESIMARGMGYDIIWIGLLMGTVSLAAGWYYWWAGIGPGVDSGAAPEDANAYWRTMVFMVLTLSQMGNALAIRSERDSLFTIWLLSNKWMLLSVAFTFILQLMVTYVPFFQGLFETTALRPLDLAIAIALSSVVFWGVELKKLVRRRWSQ